MPNWTNQIGEVPPAVPPQNRWWWCKWACSRRTRSSLCRRRSGCRRCWGRCHPSARKSAGRPYCHCSRNRRPNSRAADRCPSAPNSAIGAGTQRRARISATATVLLAPSGDLLHACMPRSAASRRGHWCFSRNHWSSRAAGRAPVIRGDVVDDRVGAVVSQRGQLVPPRRRRTVMMPFAEVLLNGVVA